MTSATGSRGFTLLELLVVLAMLVLLAGAWPLAAPRLFPAQVLRNEGQRLLSTLHHARQAARLGGAAQTVVFTERGNGYRVGSENYALPRDIGIAFLPDGSTGRASVLTFFPDGSSDGGRLDLTFGTRRLIVAVGPATGRARIVE